MAEPIQSPVKFEVRSVIRFLNAKANVKRKFTKKIVTIYSNPAFSLVSSSKETSRWEKVRRRWWGARRSHDVVQRVDGRLLWLGSKT